MTTADLCPNQRQYRLITHREINKNNGYDGVTKWRRKTKWRTNFRFLLPLLILNVKQGVTENEIRACTLSLTCWLQGGTKVKGCSGWLFSCCVFDNIDNSIPSSDWRHKVVPPTLKAVECGLSATRMIQKRIIGGREARLAEFPWQAHLRISEYQCGGVLVSRIYVATAAHCVSRARLRDISVVVQKILHPLFKFRMTQPDRYDIALLKLSRPVVYTSHILPVCLPDIDFELEGISGVIAGWGKTDAIRESL
ncbi:unnamed protein product [Leptidea sinapis]|uniref:Peptidase S1 domain-containing protein n=1 Tax=Leptidea sinapis TaxID=189913 RepID=A0A5E4PWX7_9NEOP|nr:unnamed protein product [Leptidea sinapis]